MSNAGNAQTGFDAVSELKRETGALGQALQKQQVDVEGELQTALSGVSSAVTEAQKLEKIASALTELSSLLNATPAVDRSALSTAVGRLESMIASEIGSSDAEAIKSLRSAVTSLARAQSSLSKAGAYSGLSRTLRRCEYVLEALTEPRPLH